VEIGLLEPWIGRHYGAGYHRLRRPQMIAVPVVGIFRPDARKIGAGAFRSPLERPVVHALGGERIVPIALDLVAQRPDHLRMAVVTALAHIDVAPGELERRIGPHAVDLLYRAFEIEQRRDLDETADRNYDQHADEENDRVLLKDRVFLPERHRFHSAGMSL